MTKLKLIKTYRQFEDVDRFMKRAQAVKKTEARPSTRRLRASFSRLFESYELMKLASQKAMVMKSTREEVHGVISDWELTNMLITAIHRSQCGAKIMTARLEKAAGEHGYSVDVSKATKEDVRNLPGFCNFIRKCIIPKVNAVKVISGDGKESRPLVFSANLILVQREDRAVEFPYTSYDRNFIYFLNGLAFR